LRGVSLTRANDDRLTGNAEHLLRSCSASLRGAQLDGQQQSDTFREVKETTTAKAASANERPADV